MIWPLTPVASAPGVEGGRGLPVTVNSWEPDEAVPPPAALEGVTVTDTECLPAPRPPAGTVREVSEVVWLRLTEPVTDTA